MNKDQINMLIASVRTDLVLFKSNYDVFYINRASQNLERLKKWKSKMQLKDILESEEYKQNLFNETRFV